VNINRNGRLSIAMAACVLFSTSTPGQNLSNTEAKQAKQRTVTTQPASSGTEANQAASESVSSHRATSTDKTNDSNANNRGEDKNNAPVTDRERLLLDRIEKLEQRLANIESRTGGASGVRTSDAPKATDPEQPTAAGAETATAAKGQSDQSGESDQAGKDAAQGQISNEDRGILDFFRDTTFNVLVDGYYAYNFNHPIGRVNLLRAYDVSHNSFSLNQAAVVIEQAPNVEAGRRFGLRLDLQYGQATETVQGNANNELRPQAYRPIWQAYGTYVAPIGKGLTVDFGKFAGSLGYETNYTKDNYNYSRAYFFNFLPFYHFGFRAKLPINDKLAVMYHLMNGAQQSEDFNRFKSQHFALILTPVKKVTWQVNYYVGREQRDVVPILNPTFPSLPTQPGLPTDSISPAPKGRFHVIDTYATFNVTDKFLFALEGDYVINRVEEFSAPSRVTGGAAYLRYQFTPKFALAARGEYLSDRGGLFSGVTQALKETTLTADYKIADGLIIRGEWRRDFSNQEFFLTDVQGIRKSEQNTATIGMIWWIGKKQGAW
jgi:hypothetical protein